MGLRGCSGLFAWTEGELQPKSLPHSSVCYWRLFALAMKLTSSFYKKETRVGLEKI